METNKVNNPINFNKNDINLSKYKGIFKTVAILIGALIVISILYNSFTFRVDEREQVVVRQFNKVVKVVLDKDTDDLRNAILNSPQLGRDVKILEGKGLFFKIPFLQTTESFTNMLLTYDTQLREVTTKDKKKLVLDNFAQWKIENPALFTISLKNERNAHSRIDDIIYSKLNEEIGKVDAHTVISDKSYVLQMLQRIVAGSNEDFADYGVSVQDIRIKRTDLPEDNYNNIFNRMNTEREQAAKKYRSEGKEEAQKIRSEAEKQATILEAQAYEKAEKLKGEGDAEATRIYAEAYNRDPEFYQFWKTLQTYKKTLTTKTKIVIDPDSEFAKYLFGD